MKTASSIVSGSLALLLLLAGAASSAPINEREAVAVAELWYTMEINAPTTQLSPAEKQQRLAGQNRHLIYYLVGRDDLQRTAKPDVPVIAYVVTFEPSGFVVVSGDDCLQPVLVFNATASFQWDRPEKSYLSHFLGRCMVSAHDRIRPAPLQAQPPPAHPNWTLLRAQVQRAPGLRAKFPLSSGPDIPCAIYVFWPTALWGQGNHYNEVVVAHNGGTNVPTGCTATAMAIQMRYHEWPLTGYSSHSYDDTWGTVQASHSVNFGSHAYNWSAMPTNVLTADNADVGNLMYDCGVAVEMDYEPGGSGAWPSASAMNTYFRYRGTTENASGTPADHEAAMAYCIRCGLPTVMSSSTHTVVACGYRDSVAPYFYLNGGHNNSDDGWYDLDQLGWGDLTIDRSYPYSSPDNYAYVDSTFGGAETGDLQTPYNTVAEGQTGVSEDGVLMLKAGQYTGAGNTPLLLNKPMLVRSYLGSAVVGGL